MNVFISYVREDSNTVDRLKHELESAGIEVWLDRNRIKPGTKWQQAVAEAITGGSFFVACFSSSYLQKKTAYMNEELRLAVEQMRRMPPGRVWFIPVTFDGGEVPDWTISSAESFGGIHQVDLDADWRGGVDDIISVIHEKSLPDTEEEPNERALTWNRIKRARLQLTDPISTADEKRFAAESLLALAENSLVRNALPELASSLSDAQETVRSPAIRALVKIGTEAAETLIAAVPSEFSDVREQALEGLRAMGPELQDHVDSLIGLLEFESNTSPTVSDVLGAMGEASVQPLVAAIGRGTPAADASATALLKTGVQPDSRLMETIVCWLDDQREKVRAAAARLISEYTKTGEIDWSGAAEGLARAVRESFAIYAHRAIANLGEKAAKAAPILAKIIREPETADWLNQNHDLAIRSLRRIGAPAFPALISVVEDKSIIDGVSKRHLVTSRVSAMWAIEGIYNDGLRDPSVVEALRSRVADADEHLYVRIEAASLVSRFGGPSEACFTVLIQALTEHLGWSVIENAAYSALKYYADSYDTVVELAAARVDEDRYSEELVQLLGHIGSADDERAVRALRAAAAERTGWRGARARKILEEWDLKGDWDKTTHAYINESPNGGSRSLSTPPAAEKHERDTYE